ncbi:ATP-dependent DNA helicase [Oecophyllibacter saccharovorans]|uniref:ATP-dependent DNA helicase n=1 Tax=Oecophyllibacter saccharovorans TaxID=2558360 RepID=UPI00116B9112|nr:ATP-dependent DNA helicase [Oecophyllibacter saccharovorans]TPW36736.1 ATP-dependent DNA helicase [Oecophyllibacter saccharovorans]
MVFSAPRLPPLPALIARHGLSSLLTEDGELLELDGAATRTQLRTLPPPLLVHSPATLRLLDLPPEPQPVPCLDLLELFLFVHPARPVTPTPRGLARALTEKPEALHPDRLQNDQAHEEEPGDAWEALNAPLRQAVEAEGIQADLLPQLAERLLADLQLQARAGQGESLRGLLQPMARAGWAWAPIVSSVLEEALDSPSASQEPVQETEPDAAPGHEALQVWKRLPQWEDAPPRPLPGSQPVSARAARERLARMLGAQAEARPGQADFASAATEAFAPREMPGMPNVVLAEAGTGTGKTLGYIAPASLWAENNDGAVWISTYTRHLQRQIDQELTRLYPDPQTRHLKAVVRKGRENYLCLLNFEEVTQAALNRPPHLAQALIPLALLARWAEATQDGDIPGGDLPGWFGELFPPGLLASIADRRGECIHGACPHYQSCFVEHSIRRARQADLVIANHALTLSHAAWNALVPQSETGAKIGDENGMPTRYVFDEGHHIAQAADSAFSLTFSGLEAAELRRWILGAEGSRSRARGLRRRMEDVLALVPTAAPFLQSLLDAASQALPAPGWSLRLEEATQTGTPTHAPPPEETGTDPCSEDESLTLPVQETGLVNPAENMLRAMELHLQTRMEDGKNRLATGRFSPSRPEPLDSEELLPSRPAAPSGMHEQQECDLYPLTPSLLEAAQELTGSLQRMETALRRLIQALGEALKNDPDLEPAQIERVEAAIRSLYRRALAPVQGWNAMLRTMIATAGASEEHEDATPGESSAAVAGEERKAFVDFIRQAPLPFARNGTGQREGRDIALHRHWIDPTIPFARTFQTTSHGLLVTSATLRDRLPQGDENLEWQKAEQRVGAAHFLKPPYRAALMSPFDYARQTRAYIITDVSGEIAPLARAFQQLFECAGGGALGLFTAIRRLREVYRRIHEPLGLRGLPLYAQHVDVMNNATLVDIFRTEVHSCLLGTDAMRDGVDVPGEALRMVVFERTPWPRPDILHRERRRHLLSGSDEAPGSYDDQLTRLRLRQAFGRLIRRADDYGVFVMLDRRLPSRLLSAFPEGVPVQRLPLAQAMEDISAFLARKGQGPELTEANLS